MKLRYTSRAKDELEIVLVWYERQRKGLGCEFLACVEVATVDYRKPKNVLYLLLDFSWLRNTSFSFLDFLYN